MLHGGVLYILDDPEYSYKGEKHFERTELIVRPTDFKPSCKQNNTLKNVKVTTTIVLNFIWQSITFNGLEYFNKYVLIKIIIFIIFANIIFSLSVLLSLLISLLLSY